MSVGLIGAKHTVFDIYPIAKKKILLLVDPQYILDDESIFFSTTDSIRYLAKKNASVIVAASFGSFIGVKLGSRKEEEAVRTFTMEGGTGYTNFFSNLPAAKKVEILKSVPSLEIDVESMKKGKTAVFASLPCDVKERVLKGFFPLEEFTPCSTFPFVEALRRRMPEVPVSFSGSVRLKNGINPGEVVVLENLRFFKNELSSELSERQALADALASTVDLFVNDSFVTAHVIQASTVDVPKRLQHGAAGQTLDRELAFYSKMTSHPVRPVALVVGGSGVAKKLRLIYSLVEKVDRIFVAGRVALPFFTAMGIQCGRSYPTDDEPTMAAPFASRDMLKWSQVAEKIMSKCERARVSLVLPKDLAVVKHTDDDPSSSINVDASRVPEDCYIMDIGDSSVHMFSRCLRSCRSVIWTGVLGWTCKGYDERTSSFASAIINSETNVVVAGRNTSEVMLSKKPLPETVHISSGGLTCLEIFQGNILPGIECLSDVAAQTVDHSSVSADALIRKLPLFIGCNSHQMKAISRKFFRRVHVKGDYIFHRGDKVVRLCVLAQGALIAKGGADYDSSPSRYISKENTVGMYEFISQAPAPETVRVAQNDTVTYQLSSSALHELLNAYPELAIQLLQNLSKQLRCIAADDYSKQQCIMFTTQRMGCLTRVPQSGVPITCSTWEDILQDWISTLTFQKLAMKYTPYAPCPEEYWTSEAHRSTLVGVLRPLVLYRGLPFTLGYSAVKNILYHHFISSTHQPFASSVLSATIASPIRLLSYGISFADFNFNLLLEEAMYSALLSTAPLISVALFLKSQQWLERHFRRRLHPTSQIALLALTKSLLGNLFFLIMYQRNFIYTPPSASRSWNTSAFKAYQLKLLLSVLLRVLVHYVKLLVSQ